MEVRHGAGHEMTAGHWSLAERSSSLPSMCSMPSASWDMNGFRSTGVGVRLSWVWERKRHKRL